MLRGTNRSWPFLRLPVAWTTRSRTVTARTTWERSPQQACPRNVKRMGRILRCLALAGVIGVTSAGEARAQVERGEIRLTVTDQTGLPLAATGTLTSEAPQLSRTFATDANGKFALQDLPFGAFRLIVEHNGFVPASTGVEVRTAVPRTLTIQLSLAAVSSDVTVTSEPPLVDTARTGVTFAIGALLIQGALPAVPGRRI